VRTGCDAPKRGYSFIELLIVTTILLILASGISRWRVTVQRQKEALLRDIREARLVPDLVAMGRVPSTELKPGTRVSAGPRDTGRGSRFGDATGRKVKLLRRVPVDPMTGDAEWALRSYQDKPDATRWGGQNVYDIRSTSGGTALDGTKYSDW
jgi:general secretion pathway protein G